MKKNTLDNIEWLFFDVGSTLTDEHAEYERRLKTIAESAKLPYREVYDKAAELYKEHKKGDTEVAKILGVDKPEWDIDNETLYPNTLETLKILSEKYNIGIIANQPEGTERRLRKYGLMPYIKVVVASFEEGVAKPDKKIFQIALQRAGCSANRAVMVGDRVDNDILPAKSIGMHTIWIKQGFGKFWQIIDDNEKADIVVENIADLLNIL